MHSHHLRDFEVTMNRISPINYFILTNTEETETNRNTGICNNATDISSYQKVLIMADI